MLCANVTWASFNVATRRFMPKESAVGNTALMMASGALILTAIAVVGSDAAFLHCQAGTLVWPSPSWS